MSLFGLGSDSFEIVKKGGGTDDSLMRMLSEWHKNVSD